MKIFCFYQIATGLKENILAKRIIRRIAGYCSGQLTLLVASLCLYIFPIVPACAETYTVGVVPQQATAVLARNWTPLLQYLEQSSGVSLHFKTAPNITEFEQRLDKGEYDFAYMNPYHYVMFSRVPGYRALAKEKDTLLQGVIVVRTDSGINDISQLAGKDIAFPAPLSFAASILPRMQLKKQGIAFTPHFVTSHDSVYFSVARGIYPAGGGVVRTLNSTPAEIRDQLSVLWHTDSFTPHAFAVHPRVPEKIQQALAKSMYAMDADANVAGILRNLNMRGWELGEDKDWDDLRKLPVDAVELESATMKPD